MRLLSYILLLISLITTSCNKDSSSSLQGDSFDSNSNKNAYKKQIKQFKFILQPLSIDNLLAINYKNKKLSEAETKEIKKEYSEYWCFKFEILIEDFNAEITEYYDKKDEKGDYDKLVSYYLFDMQKDLKLIALNGEETPCNIYSFERNFELVKSNRFMIGFKKPKSTNQITFSYNNNNLTIGKLNFQINPKDFTN